MEESAKLATPLSHANEKLQSSEVRQKPPAEDDEGDQIEDEIGEDIEDGGIEDFYGDDTFKEGVEKKKKNVAEGDVENLDDADVDDDDLDLDYSQTHLDDFLKSHNSSTMMKGTNIQSGQLLNSFLSTYNKMKGSGTGLSSLNGTVDQSNNLGAKRNSQAPPAEVIRENDEESIATDKKEDDDSDEELGRSEDEINLEKVSVKRGSARSTKSKAILSPEEVKKI